MRKHTILIYLRTNNLTLSINQQNPTKSFIRDLSIILQKTLGLSTLHTLTSQPYSTFNKDKVSKTQAWGNLYLTMARSQCNLSWDNCLKGWFQSQDIQLHCSNISSSQWILRPLIIHSWFRRIKNWFRLKHNSNPSWSALINKGWILILL